MPGFFSSLLGAFGKWAADSDERTQPKPQFERRRSAPQEHADLYWTDDNGERRQERVEVLGTSADGIKIHLSQPIPFGRNVRIRREEGPLIDAVIRGCEQDGDVYHASLRVFWPERRRHERRPANQPATLQWCGPGGLDVSEQVVVRDLSLGGAQVEASSPVPVQTLVRLRRRDWNQIGFSCYCKRIDEDKYRIGIHFSAIAYHVDDAEYEG